MRRVVYHPNEVLPAPPGATGRSGWRGRLEAVDGWLDRLPAVTWSEGALHLHRFGQWGCRMRLDRIWDSN